MEKLKKRAGLGSTLQFNWALEIHSSHFHLSGFGTLSLTLKQLPNETDNQHMGNIAAENMP